MERTRSYCRICAAGCGIIVTTEGNDVIAVEGDVDHPTSRGYLCAKGRGLADWHDRADRLDVPRLRGREATWDETLDDLAGALRGLLEAATPDAIALYLATGLAYDAAGQMTAPTWLQSIGSRSFLSAATVDNAPALVAAEMVTGNAMVNPAWDPHGGGLLLIVGSNPVVSHGYGTALPDPIRHLRDHRANGGRLWAIDPRITETAHQADGHLQIVPGTDVAILATLAAALIDDVTSIPGCTSEDLATLRALLDGWTIERAAEIAGIDVELVTELVREVRAHHGRVSVMCGTGAQMSRDGLLIEWLRWIILILSDSLERPGGMRFIHGVFGPPRAPSTHDTRSTPGPASRPELPRIIEQIPVVALADEIEDGNIRALIVTGGNLLTAAPDPARMRRALQSLDVLAVLDVLDGPMCELATHVLPATGQLERADFQLSIHYAMRPAVQSTPAVVQAASERRPGWWVFGELATRMDPDSPIASFRSMSSDEQFLRVMLGAAAVDADEMFAAGPHGMDVPFDANWILGWLPEGRWNLAPAVLVDRLATWQRPDSDRMVLIPRRDGYWNNSVRYGRSKDPAVVHMHPDDAAALGIVESTMVEIASGNGTIESAVRFDRTLRRGVVSVGHGRIDSSPGRLTSLVIDVDGATTMPLMSGVPVTVRAAHPAEVVRVRRRTDAGR